MPRIGRTHNEMYEVDNHRLYNLGGKRGINFVEYFPNGISMIHAGIFFAAMVVWTLPVAFLTPLDGSDFNNFGYAILLGPPAAAAFATSKKLDNDVSVAQWIAIWLTYYFRESRHYAGNARFTPHSSQVITGTVFMPDTMTPTDSRETNPQKEQI